MSKLLVSGLATIALLASMPAAAQTRTAKSDARQAQIINKAYCDDLLSSAQPPAECFADIPRGQVDIVPAQAKTGGRTPFATIAAFARHGAVVASMRNLSLQIRVAESSRGYDSTTIDLDPATVAELARLDSPAAAEKLIRARGQRCENTLMTSKCGPVPAK